MFDERDDFKADLAGDLDNLKRRVVEALATFTINDLRQLVAEIEERLRHATRHPY